MTPGWKRWPRTWSATTATNPDARRSDGTPGSRRARRHHRLGQPELDVEALAAAPNLEIVAHAAGSVRPYVDESAWDSGVHVTHAADVIAEAVAEYTLGAILLGFAGFHRPPGDAQGRRLEAKRRRVESWRAAGRAASGRGGGQHGRAPRDSARASLHVRRRALRPVRRRAGSRRTRCAVGGPGHADAHQRRGDPARPDPASHPSHDRPAGSWT